MLWLIDKRTYGPVTYCIIIPKVVWCGEARRDLLWCWHSWNVDWNDSILEICSFCMFLVHVSWGRVLRFPVSLRLRNCALLCCRGPCGNSLLVKLSLGRVEGLLDLDFNTKILQRCHLIRYGRLLSDRKIWNDFLLLQTASWPISFIYFSLVVKLIVRCRE